MASNIKEPVITLSAGPVAAFPRVLRAMSRPVQYDFDPWFQQFYEDVTRKCAKALTHQGPDADPAGRAGAGHRGRRRLADLAQ